MDNQTITVIIAIAGVIIGSASLARQFWIERHRFNFEVRRAVWNPLSTNYFALHYRISIEALLRNKGERVTTIHGANITFRYKDKSYSIERDENNEIVMQAGSAKSQYFLFNIHKDEIQIDGDITNVKLIIEHTYGRKEKTIPKITQTQ